MEAKIKTFVKNVTLAVTPEALQANRLTSDYIRIRAKTTNTNPVYIGDSASQDFPLSAGQELPLSEVLDRNGGSSLIDLAQIYCKATTNGEGVAVIYAVKPSGRL